MVKKNPLIVYYILTVSSKPRKTILNDLILIFALLFAAGILFLVIRGTGRQGAWAVVEVNGQESARYSLYTDGVYVLNGGTNTLVVENGSVYMKEADCPDKLCVRFGRISMAGESIICLPNRLTVRIEGSGEGPDFVL